MWGDGFELFYKKPAPDRCVYHSKREDDRQRASSQHEIKQNNKDTGIAENKRNVISV